MKASWLQKTGNDENLVSKKKMALGDHFLKPFLAVGKGKISVIRRLIEKKLFN